MGEVVALKKSVKPRPPTLFERSVLARALFVFALYAVGLFGLAFGMGFSLPYLIHQCAPPKPFMEKW